MTKRVELGWKAMPRATKYELQYREVGTTAWSVLISTTNNFAIVTLEVGKSYQYRVRSICGTTVTNWVYLGINVYSNAGTCVTPSGIEVEQVPNSYDFIVSWIGSGDTSWNFRYRRQGDLTWMSTTVNQPQVTLSGLAIGATYEYQIQSICANALVSDWGNIGLIDVRNNTSTQSCPFTYDEDFTGTLIGRKDTSNVVTIAGSITRTSPNPLPDAGDFIIVGSVGLCCAPVSDITVDINAAGFTGEFTITAAGQLTLYVGSYKAAPSLNFSVNIPFQGSAGTCPPPSEGGSNQLTANLTYACSSSNAQGQAILHLEFPSPTPVPVTLLIGEVENTRYVGSDIFSPAPGLTPLFADAPGAPWLINIPAGVTSFTTAGNIVLRGFGNDGVHVWTCHNTRVIHDIYVKVDSPSTFVANLSLTNSGITLHNV